MLSPRSSAPPSQAWSWEEIFEAGPYYERLAELLESARHYAIFVGWQVDSRLPLDRQRRGEGLRTRIQRLCRDKTGFHAYFLMWDHSYFYMLEREIWQGRIWENSHPRIHFIFDNRHPFGASHHEKICIVDGRVALCGGIDLCDDRWDSPDHLYADPRRSLDGQAERFGPYHDLAVQVTGPVCAEIQSYVGRRWNRICSIPFPDPPEFFPAAADSGHRVSVSRTEAPILPFSPSGPRTGMRQIEFLFRDLIRSAERRIILEGQYFWSERINDLLIAKMYEKKGTGFELVLILARLEEADSPTRHMAPYELELVERLQAAARATGTCLLAGAPAAVSPGQSPKPVYIHSKVLIIDDRYLSIGSANFAARALRLDTELHLTLEARDFSERAHVRRFADRLLAHWKQPGILLTSLRPRVDLTLFPMRPRFVRWQRFFDPLEPWSHPWKRKLAREISRLRRKRIPASALGLTLLWLATSSGAALASAAWVASGSVPFRAPLAALASIPLSSVWLLRVPFVPWALLFSAIAGWQTAARVMLVSLWIAGLTGYAVARVFPKERKGLEPVLERLGARGFEATLRVALDPGIPIHDKLIAQGARSIPVPWFAWATEVILPATLFAPLWLMDIGARAFRIEFDGGSVKITLLAALLAALAGKAFQRVFTSEHSK